MTKIKSVKTVAQVQTTWASCGCATECACPHDMAQVVGSDGKKYLVGGLPRVGDKFELDPDDGLYMLV